MRMDYDKLFSSIGYIDTTLLSSMYIPSYREVSDECWDRITSYRDLTNIREMLVKEEAKTASSDPKQWTKGQKTSIEQTGKADVFGRIIKDSLAVVSDTSILGKEVWENITDLFAQQVGKNRARIWQMILDRMLARFWTFFKTGNSQVIMVGVNINKDFENVEAFIKDTLIHSYWHVMSIEAILKAGAKRDYSVLDAEPLLQTRQVMDIFKNIGTIVDIYYNFDHLRTLEEEYKQKQGEEHERR